VREREGGREREREREWDREREREKRQRERESITHDLMNFSQSIPLFIIIIYFYYIKGIIDFFSFHFLRPFWTYLVIAFSQSITGKTVFCVHFLNKSSYMTTSKPFDCPKKFPIQGHISFDRFSYNKHWIDYFCQFKYSKTSLSWTCR
jgi:hypothetical protein